MVVYSCKAPVRQLGGTKLAVLCYVCVQFNFQLLQKFRILPLDFSIGGGELTPTLKLKRKVVAEKYSGLVEDMYKD